MGNLRHARQRFAVLVQASVISGCAGVTGGALQLDDMPKPGNTVEGIPYYEMSPYLLVTPDINGGYTTEVVSLPDPTRIRYIEPWQFLSSANIDLTFKNGTLETSAAIIDGTAIPKALIKAAVTAARSAATGGAMVADETTGKSAQTRLVVTPYLFKIDLEHEPPRLIGSGGYVIQMPLASVTRPPSQAAVAPAAAAAVKAGEAK